MTNWFSTAVPTARCQRVESPVFVAKLDRLSRDVHFILVKQSHGFDVALPAGQGCPLDLPPGWDPGDGFVAH
jgi:hypothetical protein